MQRTVLIVGAGFSGTVTAVQLLRRAAGHGLRILLVERAASFGRGLAYGARDDDLLLNVPAGNMSALADDPQHFLAYLRRSDARCSAAAFAPRRRYGAYLEDLLDAAQRASSATLERVAGEVVAVLPAVPPGLFSARLADGRCLAAHQVVLALGHFPPADPLPRPAAAGAAAALADPWDFAALDAIDVAKPVVVLGSGHTAVDALFRLTAKDAGRRVILVSRRGLLPQGHRDVPHAPAPVPLPAALAQAAAGSARAYVHAIRAAARRRVATGGDWRDVINELRPHTPELWHRLALPERRRLLQRAVPYWDVHRHRLAPAADRRLRALLASGQARVLAGRVLCLEGHGDGIRLALRPRGGGHALTLDAAAAVNCTGPRYDLAGLAVPLVRQLLAAGLLQPDPLGLGMELDAHYRVLGKDGRPVSGLFYVGPMLKARYWEAIAVPELRVHCANLAAQLLTAD